jgi:hypothetical protein
MYAGCSDDRGKSEIKGQYGSTDCGASILAVVKQIPLDRRDLKLSCKDVENLREYAARIKFKFDPEDARPV